MHLIYHITTVEQWDEARGRGELTEPSLYTEGFIHCSDLSQIDRTLERLFRGSGPLVLLAIDPERIDAQLRYEESHGELFPHIHGPLNVDAVFEAEEIEAPAPIPPSSDAATDGAEAKWMGASTPAGTE